MLGSQSPTRRGSHRLAMDLADELGLTGTELYLNSIGCPSCRADYKAKLIAYLQPKKEELCEDCKSRLERNPLRVLDCKQESCRCAIVGAPSMLDGLCTDCRIHWDEMRRILTSLGIEFQVDNALVRGLDYYTRTDFELKWPPLGAQNTLVGGGRYDGLIAELGGPAIPGVGFGMGIERILLATEKGSKPILAGGAVDVFVVGLKGRMTGLAQDTFGLVRRSGSRSGIASFDPLQRSMKAQNEAGRQNERQVCGDYRRRRDSTRCSGGPFHGRKLAEDSGRLRCGTGTARGGLELWKMSQSGYLI